MLVGEVPDPPRLGTVPTGIDVGTLSVTAATTGTAAVFTDWTTPETVEATAPNTEELVLTVELTIEDVSGPDPRPSTPPTACVAFPTAPPKSPTRPPRPSAPVPIDRTQPKAQPPRVTPQGTTKLRRRPHRSESSSFATVPCDPH
jgi:hypothetical protein